MAKKHLKVFNIIHPQENTDQSHNETLPHTSGENGTNGKIASVTENVKKLKPSFIVGRDLKWSAALLKGLAGPQKPKH